MTEVPALVNNGRLDILAANPLARALFAPVFADPTRPANYARFNFLNPQARDFWLDWERAADDTVAMLRTHAGRDPYDKALTDLVGELSTRSDEFRVRWAAHDVRVHRTGIKHIHHPVVGDLHLSYEVLELPADPGQALVAYTADPGSPTHDALRLLASWAATHQPAAAVTTSPPGQQGRGGPPHADAPDATGRERDTGYLATGMVPQLRGSSVSSRVFRHPHPGRDCSFPGLGARGVGRVAHRPDRQGCGGQVGGCELRSLAPLVAPAPAVA